ncbi:hypothetical protein P7266_0862 [Lactococcus cremoris]|nr:hypothetical protein P7266_0862 [Lactococcus cremoris]
MFNALHLNPLFFILTKIIANKSKSLGYFVSDDNKKITDGWVSD